MQIFLERLRQGELQAYSWLLADCVLRVICNMPLNGAPHEVNVQFHQALVIMKIHRHGGLRKKLFDSDMSVPPVARGVGSDVVTIAWLEDGRKMIRSDPRKGSHGMHYLQQRWSGFSILFRVVELVNDQAGAGTGSC